MDNKKYSLDDILLEVGVSSAPHKEEGVDINQFLSSLAAEKKPESRVKDAAPAEPPTKEFKPARPRQSEGHKVEESAFKPQKPVEQKGLGQQVSARSPQKPSHHAPAEESGSFAIDVEEIRRQNKPPQMTRPKSPEKEKEPESPEIHFNQQKEEADFDRRLEFTPCFRKFEEKIASGRRLDWEDILLEAKRASTLRGFFLLVLSVASLLLSMFVHRNVSEEGHFLPSFSLLFSAGGIGVTAGILGFPALVSGVRSIFKLEPNRDMAPMAGYFFCMFQYFTQIGFPGGLSHSYVHQYLPVGILILGLSFFAKTMTLQAALRNLRTLNSNQAKYEAQIIWDSRAASELTKGLVDAAPYPVVNRKTDKVSDFLKLCFSMDRSDRMGRNLTLVGIALGLLAALFTFLFTSQRHLAVTIMTAVVCVFTSVVNLYSICYPLLRCSKRASHYNGLVSGEKCGLEYGEVNAAVIEASSLFPPASVMLNGIKTFEGMRIDEAILDAASVLSEAGSIMTDVFMKIIGSRTELLRKAENIHYEDGMGLSAWIDNRRILIGNREWMAAHSIRVPSLDYERRFTAEGSDLVYLSASGELTAVFIFTLHPTLSSEEAVQALYHGEIALCVRTTDALISKERLSSLFAIEPNFFKILPTKLSRLYDECSQPVKSRPAVAINNGSFASMAYSVAASKRMRVMMSIARVVLISSIVLGGLLIAVFGLLGAMEQLSPVAMFCYPIIWLLLDFLLQRTVRL